MATLSQTGIPGAGNGILAPKLKNRWRVLFSNFGVLDGGQSYIRDLTMQAVNITRPNLSFEEVQLHRYNSVSYVAGKHTWEAINLTVEDDVTGLASRAVAAQLETQQRLIGGNLDGRWLNAAATASSYKFFTKLEMLDGDETPLETWSLEGCWLQGVDYGDMDYSASEAMTVTMTIRFDHASQKLGGQGYGNALGGFIV